MSRPQLQISIPKPCTVPWNGMTETGSNSRHCSSCDKTVTDFSRMSDEELLRFFKEPARSVCGRLSASQLDRVLVSPKAPAEISRWWKYLLLPSLLTAVPAISKTTPTTQQITAQQLFPRPNDDLLVTNGTQVNGTVKDSILQEPLPGAIVSVQYGTTTAWGTADIDGRYSISIQCRPGDSVVVTARIIGYKTIARNAVAGTAVNFILPVNVYENETAVILAGKGREPSLTGAIVVSHTEPIHVNRPVRSFLYRLFHPRKRRQE
jgi:hypothetical protein